MGASGGLSVTSPKEILSPDFSSEKCGLDMREHRAKEEKINAEGAEDARRAQRKSGIGEEKNKSWNP